MGTISLSMTAKRLATFTPNYIFSTILIKCQIENPLRIPRLYMFMYLYVYERGILNDIEVDTEVSRQYRVTVFNVA